MVELPDPGNTRCFGQRMLSPFRGIMHCVVTEWADAVTVDGRDWTLYVRGECLYDDLSDIAGRSVTIPDVKYGSWSQRDGFQRAPIRLPTFDERVRHEGDRLLAAVLQHAAQLPFALADRFELWLLNAATGLPLALIDSCCRGADCELPALLRWTPGQACMAELDAAGALAQAIRGIAGDNPRARWFERHADGSGTALPAEDDRDDQPTTLAGDRFAPLFVDREALDARQVADLDALLLWQSPALLQLPGLSRQQRAQFEAAACRHALRLAAQLPLYPEVLDRAAITAALVEARLRRSNPAHAAGPAKGPTLSPDYIEVADD